MEPPTYQALIAAAQFVWLIGITVAVALRKPGEEAGKAVRELSDLVGKQQSATALSIAAIESKSALIEERIKHLPTHSEMRTLVHEVAALKGQMETLVQGLQRWQRVTERIEDWLNNERGSNP